MLVTPTGKVELYSTILEKLGYDPLPSYEKPPETPVSQPELAKKYPFILITGARFRPMHHSENIDRFARFANFIRIPSPKSTRIPPGSRELAKAIGWSYSRYYGPRCNLCVDAISVIRFRFTPTSFAKSGQRRTATLTSASMSLGFLILNCFATSMKSCFSKPSRFPLIVI
jgi:hypothetical protein